MKRFFFTLTIALGLAACVSKEGLSPDSSRTSLGNPVSGIVVTEFADLQCPACKAAHDLVSKPVLGKYGNDIRFDYKHFPLSSLHQHAQALAEASECAADQGKFWEFVDKAFAEQNMASKQAIKDWADALALDMDLFNRCTRSRIKRDVVLADYQDGQNAGVSGTPTFFVNGTRVESTAEAIGTAIEEAKKNMTQRL